MNKNINEEIRKTLAVTDDLKKAEMPDFFYTRLKARMEREIESKPKLAWVMNPAFVVPTLAMVLLLNVLTVSQLMKNRNSVSSEESFKSEYCLDANYGVEIY
jgi:hypothetical protein